MTPRVLILTTFYHPLVGGAESNARQIAIHLHEAGNPVQVVTKRVGRSDPEQETIDDVLVHRVPPVGHRSGTGKWLVLPFMLKKMLDLRDTFDAVVCVDFRGIGIAAVLAGVWLGRPVIVQAATAGVMAGAGERSGVGPESATVRLMKAPARAIYRHADAFLCIARDIERETRRAGVPPDRVHYLPHGVDVERFRPGTPDERVAIRAAAGWPQDRLVVLSVGRLSIEKGTLDLLEAWRQVDATGAVLVLVGPDMPGHAWDAGAKARAFVATHGMADRVRFHGPSADPAPLYRAADLFVQPSHFEAFGISVLEAMASGVAVVASGVGGMLDFLVDDENALLTPPRAPERLAGALSRALGEPLLRERLAAEGLRSARAGFEHRMLMNRYLEVISSTVEAR